MTQPCGEEQLPLDDYLPGADEDDGGQFDRALDGYDRQQHNSHLSMIGMQSWDAAERSPA